MHGDYKFTKLKEKIHHLMHTDVIEVFEKNGKQLKTPMQTKRM